jgi:peptidoglycan/LPS O-acetylase OafA/YrhL
LLVGHIQQLEGVRALAIVGVVAYHLTGALGRPNVTQGQAGVDALLMVSGFLLATRVRQESAGQFLVRRGNAIAPPYWVVIALVLWGVAAVGTSLDPVADAHAVRAVVAHVAFVNSLSEPYSFTLSGSWWFMSAIMLLYLSFVPMRSSVAAGRWASVLLYGAVMQAVGLLAMEQWSTVPRESSGLYLHFVLRIPDFWLGAALGTAVQARRRGRLVCEAPWLLALSGLIVATEVMWMSAHYHGDTTLHPALRGMLVVVVGLAVGHLALAGRPRLLSAVIGWLSGISYELYLVHQPLITTFNRSVFSTLTPSGYSAQARLTWGAVIGLAIALLAADGLRRLPLGRRHDQETTRRGALRLGGIAVGATAVALIAIAIRAPQAGAVPFARTSNKAHSPSGVSSIPWADSTMTRGRPLTSS